MGQQLNELFGMAGKVVLVTGASSGLGEHFARVMASAGATVVVAARRVERLEALVTELEKGGAKAIAVAMDVSKAGNIEQALDEIEAQCGTIDVLINNAGVADSRYCLKVDEDSWDFVMDTNLKGAWRMARSVAARAIAAGQEASIVNVASILGIRVGWGESTYATSKAALVQLTKAMALELGRKNIRINALCPGYFSTELNSEYLDSEAGKDQLAKSPAGRPGELSELSGPLLLLASGAGSFINGTCLAVDGGHLVSTL